MPGGVRNNPGMRRMNGVWFRWILFYRVIVRAIPAHPLLVLLNLTAIALGVAVFTSILSANRNATAAFRAGVNLVAGNADLELRGRIPDSLLPRIASTAGVREAAPAVEWIAPFADGSGRYFRVLGIDPFQSGALRPFQLRAVDGGVLDLEAWLREPNGIAVFPGGETGAIEVAAPAGVKTLRPLFSIEPVSASAMPDPTLAVMDISWAQEAGNLQGILTSVQLVLEKGADAEAVSEALRAVLPGDVRIQTPAGRTRQTEGMLASFQLNLLALSLVAMLVGCYLIYNSVSASVLRRRTEIGILRATGAGPGLLRGLFVGEAALAGFAGSIAGLLIAMPLTDLLTGFVARTISSLYVLVSIRDAEMGPAQAALGLVLGTAAAVVAAWIPSREATTIDPKEVMHPGHLMEKMETLPSWLGWAGVGCIALSALLGWLALLWNFGAIGFVAAFLVIAGFSLLAPRAAGIYARALLEPLKAVSIPAFLGTRNLSRSIHRNSVTIAALAAAIAMLVSISVMIHSFRGSVASWMDNTLVADFFIAPAANEIAGLQNPLSPEFLEWIARHPGVREIGTFQEIPIEISGRAAMLGVISGEARGNLEFLERLPGVDWEAPGSVAVSESLAARARLSPGDSITLDLPDGRSGFQVAGIYRDYTRDIGTVLLPLSSYLAGGGESRPHSAAVFLDSGTVPAVFAEEVRELAADGAPLSVYANHELKSRIGEIFDQTFAITGVLRLVAVVVAVSGVLLSLGILIGERTREIGTLRAIGASGGQMFRSALAEAGGVGLIAGVLGLASGCALALILTYVINRAFFGWTVELVYPWAFLAATPVWVTLVALAAAVAPAWRAMRCDPVTALRSE